MTSNELEYAEKRMKQKWHDLVMEQQQGTPQPTLERMFNAYMLAVEEYNRCVQQNMPQSKPISTEVLRRKAS